MLRFKNISYLCDVIFNIFIMISLIARKYGKSKDYMLSVRVKSGSLNTAVALGISIQPQRWQLISDTIKAARKAYHRGTSIFIDDQLTSNLWLLMKRLMAEDKTSTITKTSIELAIRETLHQDEKAAIDKINERKRNEIMGMIEPEQKKPTFHEYFSIYVQQLSDGTRLKHKSTKKVSINTIKGFKNIAANIKQYEKQNNVIIDWSDINLAFFMKFTAFLTSKNLKANTIASYMQKFRTLMRSAKKLHYTVNDDFNETEWYPQGEEVDNIYVTTERIIQLYNAHLDDEAWVVNQIDSIPDNIKNKNQREGLSGYFRTEKHRRWLMEARDIYVVGCLTGQRYSDYIRINDKMYEYINGHKFIHLRQEKTSAEVYIPVDPKVETILARNGGKLPHVEREKLCKMMRVNGLMLGWTEDVSCTVTKGNMSYQENVPYYKLLKTHTCRRSFATNAYRANVPLSAIMAVTGHSSEDMLRRYLKLSNKERALFAAEELAKMQTS